MTVCDVADSEVSLDLSSCFVVGEGSVWDVCWVVTDEYILGWMT